MDPRDLAFTGAADLARMLAAGTVTAPALLEVYLDRITRIDGPLRSYRVVLADAARREAALAQDRLDGGERLPLLGVPVAIKDDSDVAGEVTTFGPGRTARRRPPTRPSSGCCARPGPSSSARPRYRR